MVNIENTDQNQKLPSVVNVGNDFHKTIKTPYGTATNANTTQSANFKNTATIFIKT